MKNKALRAVVLAAGKSSRFQTNTSKMLQPICGQPMLFYQLSMLTSLGLPISLVLGEYKDDIEAALKSYETSPITIAHQEVRNGTGGAVIAAQSTLKEPQTLILNGDTPLVDAALIEDLYSAKQKAQAHLAFITSTVIDPTGYGRVIKNENSIEIVEEKECTNEQAKVCVINAGIYLVDTAFLLETLSNLKQSPQTGEYYITDIVRAANKLNKTIITVNAPYDSIRGVNTFEELWAVEQIKRSDIIRHFMHKGVRFELAQMTHIDHNVSIGQGSCIGSGVHLTKGTIIGKNCTIKAFSILEASKVGDNVNIDYHSVIQNSVINNGAHVGPFARLRDHATLEEGSNIGNFVEVKNSTIGKKTKAKHLAYLGDATLGTNVNIGAGTITCNHDGTNKHKTIIGDNAYVGSNNTLVAPLTIANDAYTAAGSTITKDVPKDALAIGRARQENKEGYAQKLRNKTKKDSSQNSKNKQSEPSFIAAIKTKAFESSL